MESSNRLKMRWSILSALLLLLGADMAVAAGDGNARGWLLPNNTQPLHYAIHLTTHIHRDIYEFTGNSTIEVEVLEPTDELVLNAANLNISEVTIRRSGTDAPLACVTHELEAAHELLIIKRAADCAQPWSLARYQRLSVTILYAAEIGENVMGFNKFTTEDRKTTFGAATLLETSAARAAFPCYDQPKYKTNVTLTISHGANYTVYSNMPIERQVRHAENADMLTTHFATTPPMPIYLVAFVISRPLESLTKTGHGIEHRVLWLPSQGDQSNDADDKAYTALTIAKTAIDALALIGDYFDQPYVLPKLDHFLWPEFAPSGMENWGLITYQLEHMRMSANITKAPAIDTLHHELIHQWFGNLVTPQSWDDVWVAEAFASYYSFFFTNLLYPHLNATQRLEEACFSSFSRKINLTIIDKSEAPIDIDEHMRMTMYDRAPCVLQTFVHAFGAHVMQSASRAYLAANKYGHGTTSKFIDALQSVILAEHAVLNQTWPYDLTSIMTSWLTQPNYPVVSVRRDYRTDQLHITQSSINVDAKQRWWLPLNIETRTSYRTTTEKQQKAQLFMPPTDELVYALNETRDFKSEDWYLLNAEGKSFYTVNYDLENWRRIIDALQRAPRDFTPNTRISLIRNLWYACFTRSLEDPLLLLEMFKYSRHEPDILVIDQLKKIIVLSRLLIFDKTDYDALFTKFMLEPHINPLMNDKEYSNALKTRKPLNDNEFEQQLLECKQTKISYDCVDCYLALIESRNQAHLERTLDEVYRMANASETQCVCKLRFIAESTISSLGADTNLIWRKLANDFETVLEQATCDIATWATHIERTAEHIDAPDLDKVLNAIDLFDKRSAVQSADETLRAKFLESRAEGVTLPILGTRRWFFQHVNHTELHNFLLDATNAVETR